METDDVLTLLQEVAHDVVDPRFRTLDADQVGEKGPGDLVTVADREAEVRITATLQAAYPGALVLGEEATAADATLLSRFREADHAFTVDPVDGTKNFVHGSKDHAMMVAEVRGGDVVRGWIWQPQHRVAYVAERGAGAFRDGARLTRPTMDAARRERLRGVTSRRSWIGRTLGALSALELTWVCCGVDYARLAEGDADYAIYRRAAPWDHAPGSLILAEAGGYVGTPDGTPYRPQAEPPRALIAAADHETYDLVQPLVVSLPGL